VVVSTIVAIISSRLADVGAKARHILGRSHLSPETCRTARLYDEPVADPGLVEKHAGAPRIALQLATQLVDERPQGLSVAKRIGSPEATEDLPSRRHAAGLARKNLENAQLGGSQRESPPVARDFLADR
jgi:hypothetical protein